MIKVEGSTSQCHETLVIKENDTLIFVKNFTPFCYEMTNELSWLTSNIINTRDSFQVPQVDSFSTKNGYIKMQYIEEKASSTHSNKTKIEALIDIAAELHSIMNSEKPFLKHPVVDAAGYEEYLIEYTKKRISILSSSDYLHQDVSKWILSNIHSHHATTFTITHRDLRVRHLLWPKKYAKPFLIDWEYANISDPTQDIAKIVYEYSKEDKFLSNIHSIISIVINRYNNKCTLFSFSELSRSVLNILPIILLENSASLLLRKPTGYHKEILKELQFICKLYEEK